MANLLLVEDNRLLGLMEAKHLRTAFPDIALSIANDFDAAVENAKHNLPHVIVMDCKLPGGNCCDLLHDLLEISPNAKVVVTSAEPPSDLRGRSYRDKIFDILEKPFETEELVCVVERALRETSRTEDICVHVNVVDEGLRNIANGGLSFDRHQILNVLSGILAGIRAFEADLEAECEDSEAVKQTTEEYIPRLVNMVNKVTSLVKAIEQ